jgi:hypothetical protein
VKCAERLGNNLWEFQGSSACSLAFCPGDRGLTDAPHR